jgi:hypothetical protein
MRKEHLATLQTSLGTLLFLVIYYVVGKLLQVSDYGPKLLEVGWARAFY